MAADLVLYDYWRSSACYRVRIALHLKQLEFEQRPIHLVRDGGEQHSGAYRDLNPQGLIPALVHGETVISQSLAICGYLEECFTEYSLLPATPAERASARAMALSIACDIHPLNNLRVQQYLKAEYDRSDGEVKTWMNHWVSIGFEAIEKNLSRNASTGLCCFGDRPGLADLFLVPQVYNAERFDLDMAAFPLIRSITAHCRSLPAFVAAAPEAQPDAP